jgi:NADH-quinone oxidoreductase subunit E
MNAKRKDESGQNAPPQDAVEGLVRATAEAMETFMKSNWQQNPEKPGSFNPMMANPAAMMAAATAIGIGVTSQWASVFLAALQGSSAAHGGTEPETEAEDKSGPKASVEPKAAAAKEGATVAKAAAKPAAARPAAAKVDDLKLISGIGPKLMNVLVARGITTFAALAELNDETARQLDEELGLYGRILRDDWIGQARAIVSGRD